MNLIYIIGFPKTATTSIAAAVSHKLKYKFIGGFKEPRGLYLSLISEESPGYDKMRLRSVPNFSLYKEEIDKYISMNVGVVDGSTGIVWYPEAFRDYIVSIEGLVEKIYVIVIKRDELDRQRSLYNHCIREGIVSSYDEFQNIINVSVASSWDPFYYPAVDQNEIIRRFKSTCVDLRNIEYIELDYEKDVRGKENVLDLRELGLFDIEHSNKGGSVRIYFAHRLFLLFRKSDAFSSIRKLFPKKIRVVMWNSIRSIIYK